MNAAEWLRLLRIQRDQIWTPRELRVIEVDARVDERYRNPGARRRQSVHAHRCAPPLLWHKRVRNGDGGDAGNVRGPTLGECDAGGCLQGPERLGGGAGRELPEVELLGDERSTRCGEHDRGFTHRSRAKTNEDIWGRRVAGSDRG